MIRIIVQGEPVPQPRHRTVMRPGKKVEGEARRMVPVQLAAENDHGIWGWRDKIAHEIRRADMVAQYMNPVIAYELVFPRPNNAKLEGVTRRRGPNGACGKLGAWYTPAPTYCGGKGDVDNHQKCTMDVGNDVGIWPDDKRVWLVAGCMKRVASGDTTDRPRADITIWDANEFTLEKWVQWCMDHWPEEWGTGTPFVRRE